MVYRAPLRFGIAALYNQTMDPSSQTDSEKRRETESLADTDNASIAPSTMTTDSTAPLISNSSKSLFGKKLFARFRTSKSDAKREQPVAQVSTRTPAPAPSGAKDYEAAFGALSSGLGWGGGVPVKNPKQGGKGQKD